MEKSAQSTTKIEDNRKDYFKEKHLVKRLQMRTWHIYQKEGSEIETVKHGMNWWAFFFVGLWALINGLPVAGIVGISVAIAVQMPAIDPFFALMVIIGMMFLYGLKGNSWICQKLEKDGYMLIDKVEAASKDGAKAKIAGG